MTNYLKWFRKPVVSLFSVQIHWMVHFRLKKWNMNGEPFPHNWKSFYRCYRNKIKIILILHVATAMEIITLNVEFITAVFSFFFHHLVLDCVQFKIISMYKFTLELTIRMIVIKWWCGLVGIYKYRKLAELMQTNARKWQSTKNTLKCGFICG